MPMVQRRLQKRHKSFQRVGMLATFSKELSQERRTQQEHNKMKEHVNRNTWNYTGIFAF